VNNKKWEIYVVPGSHFDLGWTCTPAESFARGDEIIKEAIDYILGDYPDYRFTIEYAWFLKHFLERYPAYKGKVVSLLKEGKIEICAACTGMMDQMLDGEIIIRQMTHSVDWIKKELGIRADAAQFTDTPGRTYQLPQILAKSGIKYLSFSRFSPPVPLHFFESSDGSRVLAANHAWGLYKGLGSDCHHAGYGWTMYGDLNLRNDTEKAERLLPEQLLLIEKNLSGQILFMGDEADLIRGNPQILNSISEWNKKNKKIKLHLSTISEFFRRVDKNTDITSIPVYQGEAPYEFYSIPAFCPKVYKVGRKAENMLSTAEKCSVLGEIFCLGSYPMEELHHAWEDLFYCHDHNVGGMRGAINDRIRLNKARNSLDTASSISEEIMYKLGANIAYSRKAPPILVFNPLSWERNEIISSSVILSGKVAWLTIKDKNGKKLPVQIDKRELKEDSSTIMKSRCSTKFNFSFLASQIPSLGYKTFYILPNKKKEHESEIRVSSKEMENNFFRLQFASSGLKSIKHKGENLELIKEDGYDFNQVFALEDIAQDVEEKLTGKHWKSEYGKFTVLENNILRATVQIEGKILNSPISQRITLYKDLPQIDLSTTVNWEGRKNTQVRISYPFNVPDGKITYETPFGSVLFQEEEMENTYRGTGGRFVQKWIDISNNEFGVTLASRSAGFSLKNPSTVYPVLLRTAYSCGDRFYWYYNRGEHNFAFSICPHRGNWKESLSFRKGWEFNNPLLVDERRNLLFYYDSREKGHLPEKFSFIKVDNPNIVITAVKKAADNKNYIVRFFNVLEKRQKILFKFPFSIKEAFEVNLLEEKVKKVTVKKDRVVMWSDECGIHSIKIKKRL